MKNPSASQPADISSPRVSAAGLDGFLAELFTHLGAPSSHARTVSRHLVESNLAGHDSHGAMRAGQYVEAIENGQVEPGAAPIVVNESPSGGVIDGQMTFGQVAGFEGMKLAIQHANRSGIGGVAVRHCYHTGRIASYALQAAREGCIGLVMANAGGGGQWVAAFGGLDRRMSTNPLALAAPSAGDFPVCLDMATSVAPEGKIRDYLQKGRPIPDGWVIDCEGQNTNDPNDLYDSPGVVLPLGGTSGGHKGFGLAMMVDILAGGLSGAGCCRPDPKDTSDGMMMLAIDIQRYSPVSIFEERIRELVAYVQSSKTAPGFDRVMVPGEWEHRIQVERTANGIPIPATVWNSFLALAEKYEVPMPKDQSTDDGD